MSGEIEMDEALEILSEAVSKNDYIRNEVLRLAKEADKSKRIDYGVRVEQKIKDTIDIIEEMSKGEINRIYSETLRYIKWVLYRHKTTLANAEIESKFDLDGDHFSFYD